MSDNKRILRWLIPCFLLLAGCSVRLDPGQQHPMMPPGIFDALLPVAQIMAGAKDTLKGFSPTIEGWVAPFSEHKIEQDDLLALSNLGDSSSVHPVKYDSIIGFHQNLLLFHLRALPRDIGGKAIDVVAYLAIHYDSSRKVIHTGPLYFGCVNKRQGHIDFFYELKLKKNGENYSLVPKRSLRHLKALAPGQHDTKLLFLADELKISDIVEWWQPAGISTIKVNKIVSYDPNKIGGRMPLVFTIPEVMRDDSAIYFVPISYR